MTMFRITATIRTNDTFRAVLPFYLGAFDQQEAEDAAQAVLISAGAVWAAVVAEDVSEALVSA
jgi:hypothetical protein